MTDAAPLILASRSPARAKLLTGAGLTFKTYPADIDEGAIKSEWEERDGDTEKLAVALARAKAEKVAAAMPGAHIIGADQLLILNGRILDKPTDLAAARQRLQCLRGRPHRLVTATVIIKDDVPVHQCIESAELIMRDFTDAFLDHYLSKEGTAALASVGAYRMEGLGIQLFEQISGQFDVILGLSLLPILSTLRREGVLPA